MPWTDAPDAGFSSAKPWLPIPSAHRALHQAGQSADAASPWRLTQAALRLRKQTPALAEGPLAAVGVTPSGLLHLRRSHAQGDVEAFFNLSDRPAALPPGPPPLLGTHPSPEADRLRPCEGLLRPAAP
jgi:glycosidase